MQEKNLYEDSLIIITDDSITLKNYYFLPLKRKRFHLKPLKGSKQGNLQYGLGNGESTEQGILKPGFRLILQDTRET